MRHIIFKMTGEIPGYIKVIGSYMNYYYGRIEDIYDDMRLDLDKFNASVISEDVGKGFIFADIYKSYVSIRTNSSLMDEVPVLAESSETEEEKVKYKTFDHFHTLLVYTKIGDYQACSPRESLPALGELPAQGKRQKPRIWTFPQQSKLAY